MPRRSRVSICVCPSTVPAGFMNAPIGSQLLTAALTIVAPETTTMLLPLDDTGFAFAITTFAVLMAGTVAGMNFGVTMHARRDPPAPAVPLFRVTPRASISAETVLPLGLYISHCAAVDGSA